MSRWDPNARGRLEQAAYELFRDSGYERTTVADIAMRAGLTERTFFRHYADKREVLFGGSAYIREELLRALGTVSAALPAIEAVRTAVETIATLMRGRRVLSRERRQIIEAHVDLQERELMKRATLTAALAEALRERGVPLPTANLVADIGIGVFYIGFGEWLDDSEGREFDAIVRENFDRLKAVAAEI